MKYYFAIVSKCNRKKSRIVGDNTIAAERLGDFFKDIGKKSSMLKNDG